MKKTTTLFQSAAVSVALYRRFLEQKKTAQKKMKKTTENTEDTVMEIRGGMSLRDWFAGQALAFYNAGVSGGAPWPAKQSVAKHAYQMADAMLIERERKEVAQ